MLRCKKLCSLVSNSILIQVVFIVLCGYYLRNSLLFLYEKRFERNWGTSLHSLILISFLLARVYVISNVNEHRVLQVAKMYWSGSGFWDWFFSNSLSNYSLRVVLLVRFENSFNLLLGTTVVWTCIDDIWDAFLVTDQVERNAGPGINIEKIWMRNFSAWNPVWQFCGNMISELR